MLPLFSSSETAVGGLGPLLILLVALLLDAGFGSAPRWLPVPHPVRLIGGLIGRLDRKLNRDSRSDRDRAVRGCFVVVVVVGLAVAIGWSVAWLGRNHDFGWMVELVLVASLIAQRSLFLHVRAVSRALKADGVVNGREVVSLIVGRDVSQLDEHGVARAAIESCAENFSDGVVAPVFWYLLFGLPGLLGYKAINTLDSMIGHKSPRHQAFGGAAARLDDVVNWVPARISGLMLCLAALFVPTANPAKAVRTMIRDARNHRSPNAGWPEAAAAGALGLALAGPRRYAERVVDDRWLGDGRARAVAKDVDRMLYLFGVGCLINAFSVAILAVAKLAV